MSTDPYRSDRVVRRTGIRVAIGILVGPLVGGALGLLLGSIVFGSWSRGMWAALVAGMAFGALGGFFAGMSALGPPAPVDDPLPREESGTGTLVERSGPEGADPRR
jgi:hypothetical protein